MNNLQRIERFCGAQWSTASGMRNLLNTINIICAQKDTEAFDALLQQCTHNRQLAGFVLDFHAAVCLSNNQWDTMWMKFIGLTLECVPEKIDNIIRCVRANPNMYHSAQDLVWQKIGVCEQNICKDPQNLQKQQILLSSMAVVALEEHNRQLYNQCFERWREFDKMYVPLQNTLEEQISYAGKTLQVWLPKKIMPYLQKKGLIVEYMEQALQMGGSHDVEELMKQHNSLEPKDTIIATKIVDFIVKRQQLWTAENIILIKNLCTTPTPPRVNLDVLSVALEAHYNDGLDFSAVLELCDKVCASPSTSHVGALTATINQSVTHKDFRVLKHMSHNHSEMYFSALKHNENSFAFFENLNSILFQVDHATDVFISRSELDNENINAFRQKLKLSEATQENETTSDLSATKRKI